MSERPINPDLQKPETTKQEVELTPEIIEIVMEKVDNINSRGTAFHVLNAQTPDKKEILIDVLRDGILGQTHQRKDEVYRAKYRGEPRPHTQRSAYVEDVKRGEMPEVYFNIVGRMDGFRELISESHYMRSILGATNIAIVFDLSQFSDALGTQEEYEKELKALKTSGSTDPEKDYFDSKSRIGNFWPSHGAGPDFRRENSDLWSSDNPKEARSLAPAQDYGHVLMGRVSPRHFKGIVLKVNNLERAKSMGLPAEELDPNIVADQVNKIVDMQLKVYKLTPDKILPIYDMHGNLIWPKRMDRKELHKEEEK